MSGIPGFVATSNNGCMALCATGPGRGRCWFLAVCSDKWQWYSGGAARFGDAEGDEIPCEVGT